MLPIGDLRLDDAIAVDEALCANLNLDPTRRQGFEPKTNWAIAASPAALLTVITVETPTMMKAMTLSRIPDPSRAYGRRQIVE